MTKTLNIHAAGNTMAPCWVELTARGYKVSSSTHNEEEVWTATKPGQHLSAPDPCTLLGLASLAERGDTWQANDEQVDEFLRLFYPVIHGDVDRSADSPDHPNR